MDGEIECEREIREIERKRVCGKGSQRERKSGRGSEKGKERELKRGRG